MVIAFFPPTFYSQEGEEAAPLTFSFGRRGADLPIKHSTNGSNGCLKFKRQIVVVIGRGRRFTRGVILSDFLFQGESDKKSVLLDLD